MLPLVSVIIPVFNGERYVGEALASVLAQTYRTLEVISVDDDSTDGSVDVAKRAADPRCRILHQSRSGAAAARNLGIAQSRGSYLAFLDADDLWTEGKLARQVRALLDDPALAMVFGHYVEFRDDREASASCSVARPGYSLGTALIRADSFQQVGPLSASWQVGEFIDWYARAEEAGLRHAMLTDVVLRRRVHDANLTGSAGHPQVDYARIVRAAAVRRGLFRRDQS